MKKNTIIAAIAAASALILCASCQKQELIEQNNGNASGKTFTATIEQSLTKTTITSEYKVNWETGDQIDINGSIFSATPDASDATKASLTKVSGSDPDGTLGYTAVYPASIMVETQATLPATQTYAAGKFNAPMCAMSSTESLEFKNFCGVLCFALKGTNKVKSIAVTANEQLCGPFEFADATSFSFSGENEGYTVTLDCGAGVQLSSTDSTNFYVYLPPKDSYTAGMKIVVTSTEGKTFEKTTTTAVKIERNNLYTFDWTASFSGSAEPEYVEIGGLKWATKNLGAKKVTDSGDYFAWGETTPYYEGTGGWPATPTWKEGKTSGYKWDSYCGQSSFVEWSTPPYDATTKILKPDFDAAAQILGDGWRMPTSAEFQALYDACGGTETPKTGGSTSTTEKGVYWCTSYDGVAGCLFCDGTNKLFFPAAGYGDGTSLFKAGSDCFYWSSSLYTGSTDFAYYLYFGSGHVDPQNFYYRYRGFSVRPVKDAAAPLPADALPGEFSVSATKKVHFSKGNLTYDINASTNKWKFYEHQYDRATGYDSNLISLFTWGYDAAKSIVPDGKNYVEGHSTDGEPFSKTEDWGYVFGGESSVWRTLTTAEWQYLFNWDTNDVRNGKCRWATVNGVGGYVIAPDDFTGTLQETYADDAALAANNLVFLPAAGNRDGSKVNYVGYGYYWSSTAYNESFAYYVFFFSDDVYPGYLTRDYGFSVRLVTEVK